MVSAMVVPHSFGRLELVHNCPLQLCSEKRRWELLVPVFQESFSFYLSSPRLPNQPQVVQMKKMVLLQSCLLCPHEGHRTRAICKVHADIL